MKTWFLETSERGERFSLDAISQEKTAIFCEVSGKKKFAKSPGVFGHPPKHSCFLNYSLQKQCVNKRIKVLFSGVNQSAANRLRLRIIPPVALINIC